MLAMCCSTDEHVFLIACILSICMGLLKWQRVSHRWQHLHNFDIRLQVKHETTKWSLLLMGSLIVFWCPLWLIIDVDSYERANTICPQRTISLIIIISVDAHIIIIVCYSYCSWCGRPLNQKISENRSVLFMQSFSYTPTPARVSANDL